MAKYIFHVSTNAVNSTVEEVFEIPDEELEGLSEEEEEEVVGKYFNEWKADKMADTWTRIQ
ncbi:DUF7167 family protein [Chengkuizengella axinellae]|uniref:DUF7167 domain-containing protein n=1 Tax=Chengkuizengella axinellae TaxID=3064388 RepID=A0ABT9IZQ3_9BACL|nr:hypothetical protein [Chengkuizengella sp. 2205SS18-9]MDP5274812.1 hypothetical protein [Chengkuizengella sp. 2205SS18-9]